MSELDQINVGIIDLDAEGQVDYTNRLAQLWLGADRTGIQFSNLLYPGSRLFFLNHLFPLLHTGQDLEEAYLSLLDCDGLELPVLLSATNLPDGRKRLSLMPIRRRAIIEQQLLKAKQDAEAAMRAEQQALESLKQAQAKLALQDRLAVMGTLAAGVAHELNNPLAYVMGNLELLKADHLDEEERLSLIDIKEGVKRIHGIVNSLKILSRTEDERKVPIDLNQLAQVACRLSSKEMSNRCQLECQWQESPVVAEGDEGKVTQVILNLLLNSCQAFLRPDPMRNLVQVRTWCESGEAFLEVSDNGPGIPDELRSRIFDPFFTTKPVGTGTGLGLSICQGIVKTLDGRLELVPSRSGACFRLAFPLASRARPAQVQARGLDQLQGLKCLVIDDDPKVARIFQRLLSKCECQVALGGVEGLECLRRTEPFDLIICDLMMPDLSGIEVYQAAPQTRRARFVFVTGGVLAAEVESFLSEVQAPVLNKPFEREQLLAAYKTLIRNQAQPEF
ncbi:MAG: ATP-binding protein [Vulcanimicrobiota bacterium]